MSTQSALELRSPRRDLNQRRAYYGRPHAYIREVLGRVLAPKAEEMVALIETNRWTAFPGATNLYKSDTLSAYCLYWFDAVAAVADPNERREERGARIMILGPGHDSVMNFYGKIIRHAERAEARGFPMPARAGKATGGGRSVDSVLWRVAVGWEIEPFSPPKAVGQTVQHSMSGRHEGALLAIVTEAAAVGLPGWNALEGMLSGQPHLNKIIAEWNPTPPAAGPAFERSQGSQYKVMWLSAFDHPNVLQRAPVIPDAVSHLVIDGRMRDECKVMGPAATTTPSVERGDFLYALPPADGLFERGGRADGIPGHPDAEVLVLRPRELVESQVLGRYPKNVEYGLFQPATIDEAVARWKAGSDPATLPDQLGVDAAREGADDCAVCPSWGDDGETLLRAWANATAERSPRLLTELREKRRIRLGEIVIVPKGDGVISAEWIARRPGWAGSTWNVDEGGVGSSLLDHAARVLRLQARGVSFAASAPAPVPGEQWCENARAAMYVRCAMLLDRGLLDLPEDAALKEELLAHRLVPGEMRVEVTENGVKLKRTVPSVRVLEKAEIKKLIGRSPDRSDAVVLAVWRTMAKTYSGGVAEMPRFW